MVMEPRTGLVADVDAPLYVDLYELTMAQGYFERDHDPTAVFDLFVRRFPEDRGYLVFGGLERIVSYLESFAFDESHLAHLEELGFRSDFLDFLEGLSFTGDVWSLKEGDVFFPNEPVVEVEAPMIEAQLLETFLINSMVVPTLTATKGARIVEAAGDIPCVDYGSRRAHGFDAGIQAARASYIGGFAGTSNVLASKLYGIPCFGTMAHSWIESFPSERESFREYVQLYGEESILLIDTYDTLDGARKAAEINREFEARTGKTLYGVRLDSGDLVSLSKEVRRILDREGWTDARIVVSSGLDEYVIEETLGRGLVADSFGVGTALVTSSDAPTLDGVYKLVGVERDGEVLPKMKVSRGKVTYPGKKQVHRFGREAFERDVLATREEQHGGEPLLSQVMENGQVILELEGMDEVRDRVSDSIGRLPPGVKKNRDPKEYPVKVSSKLESITQNLRRELVAN